MFWIGLGLGLCVGTVAGMFVLGLTMTAKEAYARAAAAEDRPLRLVAQPSNVRVLPRIYDHERETRR